MLESHPQRVALLRGKLIEALKGREEGYTDGTSLIVGRPPLTVLAHTNSL